MGILLFQHNETVVSIRWNERFNVMELSFQHDGTNGLYFIIVSIESLTE